MQQFVVPQFIDVESKILGPITMRQFVVFLVILLLEFIAYKLSDTSLFILISIFLFVIGGTIAFGKVNGMPIHYFILNFVQSLKKPNLRVWDKRLSDSEIRELLNKPRIAEKTKIATKVPLSGSHLAELSLIVDTGGVYKGENR